VGTTAIAAQSNAQADCNVTFIAEHQKLDPELVECILYMETGGIPDDTCQAKNLL